MKGKNIMATMKHTNKTDEPKEISRNWATILYPESAKENWLEILEKQGIQTAISPIHDKDVTDDGEPKKPHYHIIFRFETPKSMKQVKEIGSLIGSVGAERIRKMKSAVQYLSHMNTPEKAEYNFSDIKSLNGFPIEKYAPEISPYQISTEIKQFIRDNLIDNYADLMDGIEEMIAIGEFNERHYTYAESKSYSFNAYLTSRRQSVAKQIIEKKRLSYELKVQELLLQKKTKELAERQKELQWHQTEIDWENLS